VPVRIHLRRRFGATTALRAGLGTRELRLKNPEEREDAPPRNIWLALQENEKDFARAENSLRRQEPILVDE